MYTIILIILIILIIYIIINIFQVESMTEESYIYDIKNFTKQISIYRPIESNNLMDVKYNVINEMSKYMNTVEQKFTRTIRNKTYNFSNLISINKKALNNNYILLGAHIDSPQIDQCESTIDAATGIAIIIELTKNILKNNPNFPLMVVFFDGEEAVDGDWSNDNTLSGSRYFVDNYDINIIKYTYIFDLIGGNFKDNMIACFNDNINSINDMKKLYEINLKYNNMIFANPDTFMSNKKITDDHTPFMEKNKYVVDLIPYNFPSTHHTLDDNYINVNWDYVDIFYKVLYEFCFYKFLTL